MNKEVVRAHCNTLLEWATLYEQRGAPADGEIGFCLRRAVRLMAEGDDLDMRLAPEPRPKEPPVTEAKADVSLQA